MTYRSETRDTNNVVRERVKRENHSCSACAKPLTYRIEKKTVQPLVGRPTVGRLKKKLSRTVPKQIEVQYQPKNLLGPKNLRGFLKIVQWLQFFTKTDETLYNDSLLYLF